MGYVYPPVPIDLTNRGTAPPNPIGVAGQMVTGPFVFSGKLYIFLQTPGLSGTCEVFRSADNGVTWTQVAIGGSSAGATFSVSFDGVHTVRCAFCGTSANFVAVQVQDFDMTTETWGGATAGGPNAKNIYACQILGNGNTLIVYQATNTTIASFGAVMYSAGFGVPFQLDANATSGLGAMRQGAGFAYAMNSGNTVMHCTFGWEISGPTDYTCYQIVNQDGTLGTFHAFAAGVNGLGAGLTPVEMIPVVYGTNVVLSFASGIGGGPQALYVGTPLAAPTFTFVPPIDPGYPADSFLIGQTAGQGFVSGGVLYLPYIVDTTDGTSSNRIRYLQTSNPNPALGWSGVDIFNGNTQGGAGWTTGQLGAVSASLDKNGNISIGFTSPATSGPFALTRYWLQSAASGTLALSGTPPGGVVGMSYSFCYSATGGTPPYTWAVTSGALPSGLTLGATGCITGTPTFGGTYNFVVTVTDSTSASQSLSSTIQITAGISPATYGASQSGAAAKLRPCRTTSLDWSKFSRILESVRPEPVQEVQYDACVDIPDWRKR